MISDDDHNTIDEPTSLGFSEDVSAGFKALGWITITADNTHGDMDPFKNPLLSALGETEKPAFIRVCAFIKSCLHLCCIFWFLIIS